MGHHEPADISGGDAADGRLRAWWSSLNRGFKVLVAVAAGVATLASGVTAVRGLWPEPTPVQSGRLSDVAVDRDVTLSEFTHRHLTGSSLAPPAAARLRAAGYLIAQGTEPTAPAGEEPPGQAGDEPVPESGEPAATDPATETVPGPETSTNGGPPAGGTGGSTTGSERLAPAGSVKRGHGGELLPDPNAETQAKLQEGVLLAGEDDSVADVKADACVRNLLDERCGLRSSQSYLRATTDAGEPADVEPVELARRLAIVLRNSRTLPDDTPGSKGEPLGVTVNFKLSVQGYRDQDVDVRWSLYDAGRKHRVPRDWLAYQRAMLLRASADDDSTAGEFWLPLPRVRGPFFVRIGAYEDDGGRIAYADSPRVR